MIRRATLLDIPFIAQLSAAYEGEAKHHGAFSINTDKLMRGAAQAISDPESCVLVAIEGTRMVGFLYAVLNYFLWSDTPLAVDQLLYTTPEVRGKRHGVNLIKAYERWAASRGVSHVRLTIAAVGTEDRTCKLYERLGYTMIASTCQKEVAQWVDLNPKTL